MFISIFACILSLVFFFVPVLVTGPVLAFSVNLSMNLWQTLGVSAGRSTSIEAYIIANIIPRVP